MTGRCIVVDRSDTKAESPPRSREVRDTTIRAEIAEGLRFVWRDRLLLRLTIFPAAANLAYGGSLAIMVVFLVRVAHFGSGAVGLLMAVSGVGSLIGRDDVSTTASSRPAGATTTFCSGAVSLREPSDMRLLAAEAKP